MGARGTAYERVTTLAAGGMGTVDVCVRRFGGFQRLCAVKRLHPHLRGDEAMRSMFLDEARLAALIRHANVVSVIDFGEDAEGPYFVMDYVEGVSLSAFIERHAREGTVVPIAVCMRIAAQVAAGLHAAHELLGPDGEPLHLVHRDVSPQNVLVGRDGLVRVTDFGIAKCRGQSTHTTAGLLKGKIGHMAPEQLRFEPLDRRSDLFALGVVLFELITTRRLYARPDATEVARAILDDPPPDVGDERVDAPPELVELVFELLAKDRDDRPPSAAEVAHRLEAAIPAEAAIDLAEYVDEHLGSQLDASRKRIDALVDDLGVAAPRAHRRRLVIAAAALSMAGVAYLSWPPPAITPRSTSAFAVQSFAADWSTPNSIHWAWSIDGDAADFHGFELWLATSEAALDDRRDSIVFDGRVNPELGRFELRNTAEPERVLGTITDGLDPDREYFARLHVLDTAGGRTQSPNVAVRSTTTSPSHGVPIFVDDDPFPGHVLPPCYARTDRAPFAGSHHYELVLACNREAVASCERIDDGAPECWENLRWGGIDVPIAGLDAGDFVDAYLEVAIAVDPPNDGIAHGWWGELSLDAGGEDWWYAPITIRADGEYRRYQVPLSRFGLAPERLDARVQGVLIGSMWRNGSTIRVDQVWIRW